MKKLSQNELKSIIGSGGEELIEDGDQTCSGSYCSSKPTEWCNPNGGDCSCR